METKKILSMLILTMFLTSSITIASASDDDYYDNDKYENKYDKYDDDEYINPSDLPDKIKTYISQNYTSVIKKAEIDDGEYEVELRDGTEVKFYLNGDFKYAERDDDYDDDYYEKNNSYNANNRDVYVEQKIVENKELKAKYKAQFKVKLADKLDAISKTKLETIVILIDTKLLELDADTTKTIEEKERLVAIYGAIRDLITDKISETSESDILNELFQ